MWIMSVSYTHLDVYKRQVYHDTMANFAEISKLNVGAAIIVKGTLVPTPEAKQPFEIQAEEVQVEGASAPDYPCLLYTSRCV